MGAPSRKGGEILVKEMDDGQGTFPAVAPSCLSFRGTDQRTTGSAERLLPRTPEPQLIPSELLPHLIQRPRQRPVALRFDAVGLGIEQRELGPDIHTHEPRQ